MNIHVTPDISERRISKQMLRGITESTGLGTVLEGTCIKHGDEASCSINARNFLTTSLTNKI
jgi:hypothetical protein